jgi:hypothetical protein
VKWALHVNHDALVKIRAIPPGRNICSPRRKWDLRPVSGAFPGAFCVADRCAEGFVRFLFTLANLSRIIKLFAGPAGIWHSVPARGPGVRIDTDCDFGIRVRTGGGPALRSGQGGAFPKAVAQAIGAGTRSIHHQKRGDGKACPANLK